MPRYFLHVCNDHATRDENGSDFHDFDAARLAAVRGISELVAATIVAGNRVRLSNSIVIEDGQHQVIETIRFGDLFID